MANELTLTAALSFSKGKVSVAMNLSGLQVTVSGSDYLHETMTVPTSITALGLGSVATPGFIIIRNNDATNYVDVYDSAAGNACVRIKPGEIAMFRFAVTTPAAKANTASVQIEYLLIPN